MLKPLNLFVRGLKLSGDSLFCCLNAKIVSSDDIYLDGDSFLCSALLYYAVCAFLQTVYLHCPALSKIVMH
jgi:hypothetical protein